jgi:hypothetical protein
MVPAKYSPHRLLPPMRRAPVVVTIDPVTDWRWTSAPLM